MPWWPKQVTSKLIVKQHCTAITCNHRIDVHIPGVQGHDCAWEQIWRTASNIVWINVLQSVPISFLLICKLAMHMMASTILWNTGTGCQCRSGTVQNPESNNHKLRVLIYTSDAQKSNSTPSHSPKVIQKHVILYSKQQIDRFLVCYVVIYSMCHWDSCPVSSKLARWPAPIVLSLSILHTTSNDGLQTSALN